MNYLYEKLIVFSNSAIWSKYVLIMSFDAFSMKTPLVGEMFCVQHYWTGGISKNKNKKALKRPNKNAYCSTIS